MMYFQEVGSYEDIAEYLLWNSNVNIEKVYECGAPTILQNEYQLKPLDHL